MSATAYGAEEFGKAKAALLANPPTSADPQVGQYLSDQLAEVRYQNELARIDRDWEMERQPCLLAQEGQWHVPSTRMAIWQGVGAVVFGLIFMVVAIAINPAYVIPKVAFALLGLLFIGAGAIGGFFLYSRAEKYNEAFRAYWARRSKVSPEQFRE